jgi:hypothetical protein
MDRFFDHPCPEEHLLLLKGSCHALWLVKYYYKIENNGPPSNQPGHGWFFSSVGADQKIGFVIPPKFR